MIDSTTVLTTAAVCYAVISLGLGLGTRRVAPDLRRYCYPLIGLVGLAAVESAVQAAGGGTVAFDGTEIRLSTYFLDVAVYLVLYGGTTLLAGTSRRLAAAVTGVALLQRTAFVAGNAAAPGTILATLAGLGIVLGLPVLLYLFLKPVWRAAQSVPARQRLLHWKARNLQLFLFGMLVVYAFLYLSGAVSDPFVSQILVQYPNMLFRAGIPVLLVYKLATFEGCESLSLRYGGPSDSTVSESESSGTAD